LAVAGLAAAALNMALLATFGYTELMTPAARTFVWGGLGLVWAAAAAVSLMWERRRTDTAAPDRAERAFAVATEHYLKGNWFEAESTLTRVLRGDPRDLEARLMLATLLRHTGRPDEATSQLDTLKRLEGAERWAWEIQSEYDLLSEASTGAQEPNQQSETTPLADSPSAEQAA
jgi:Flp pilus assembly protein TadD